MVGRRWILGCLQWALIGSQLLSAAGDRPAGKEARSGVSLVSHQPRNEFSRDNLRWNGNSTAPAALLALLSAISESRGDPNAIYHLRLADADGWWTVPGRDQRHVQRHVQQHPDQASATSARRHDVSYQSTAELGDGQRPGEDSGGNRSAGKDRSLGEDARGTGQPHGAADDGAVDGVGSGQRHKRRLKRYDAEKEDDSSKRRSMRRPRNVTSAGHNSREGELGRSYGDATTFGREDQPSVDRSDLSSTRNGLDTTVADSAQAQRRSDDTPLPHEDRQLTKDVNGSHREDGHRSELERNNLPAERRADHDLSAAGSSNVERLTRRSDTIEGHEGRHIDSTTFRRRDGRRSEPLIENGQDQVAVESIERAIYFQPAEEHEYYREEEHTTEGGHPSGGYGTTTEEYHSTTQEYHPPPPPPRVEYHQPPVEYHPSPVEYQLSNENVPPSPGDYYTTEEYSSTEDLHLSPGEYHVHPGPEEYHRPEDYHPPPPDQYHPPPPDHYQPPPNENYPPPVEYHPPPEGYHPPPVPHPSNHAPLVPEPEYEPDTPCRRTGDDPDGDCIRGVANLDYPTLQTIPVTGFSCHGRPPGFYADMETACQVWHYCTGSDRAQSFLCTTGTVFSQRHLVCDWWYSVDCPRSDVYQDDVNSRLYRPEEYSEVYAGVYPERYIGGTRKGPPPPPLRPLGGSYGNKLHPSEKPRLEPHHPTERPYVSLPHPTEGPYVALHHPTDRPYVTPRPQHPLEGPHEPPHHPSDEPVLIQYPPEQHAPPHQHLHHEELVLPRYPAEEERIRPQHHPEDGHITYRPPSERAPLHRPPQREPVAHHQREEPFPYDRPEIREHRPPLREHVPPPREHPTFHPPEVRPIQLHPTESGIHRSPLEAEPVPYTTPERAPPLHHPSVGEVAYHDRLPPSDHSAPLRPEVRGHPSRRPRILHGRPTQRSPPPTPLPPRGYGTPTPTPAPQGYSLPPRPTSHEDGHWRNHRPPPPSPSPYPPPHRHEHGPPPSPHPVPHNHEHRPPLPHPAPHRFVNESPPPPPRHGSHHHVSDERHLLPQRYTTPAPVYLSQEAQHYPTPREHLPQRYSTPRPVYDAPEAHYDPAPPPEYAVTERPSYRQEYNPPEYRPPGPGAVQYISPPPVPEEEYRPEYRPAEYVPTEYAPAAPQYISADPTAVPDVIGGYGRPWEPKRVRYVRTPAPAVRVTTPRPVISHRGTTEPYRQEVADVVATAAETEAERQWSRGREEQHHRSQTRQTTETAGQYRHRHGDYDAALPRSQSERPPPQRHTAYDTASQRPVPNPDHQYHQQHSTPAPHQPSPHQSLERPPSAAYQGEHQGFHHLPSHITESAHSRGQSRYRQFSSEGTRRARTLTSPRPRQDVMSGRSRTYSNVQPTSAQRYQRTEYKANHARRQRSRQSQQPGTGSLRSSSSRSLSKSMSPRLHKPPVTSVTPRSHTESVTTLRSRSLALLAEKEPEYGARLSSRRRSG